VTGVILVVGASGFIGGSLVARLSGRARIRALQRRASRGAWEESVCADIAEGVPEAATAGVDTVFHLAARTHALDARTGDEDLYRRVNVDGTRALLEASKQSGVRRFVFVSSVKAMGEGGDAVIDESATPRPTTAYGRTKLEAERLVLEGGFVPEPVVLRPTLVYGPGVKGNIAAMMAAIESGRFPPPPRLDNRRSLVHVDDVAAAAVLAAESARAIARVFIVTGARPYSTREMYESMCRALGRSVPRWGVPAELFRGLAAVGDALAATTRRPWAFDSSAYHKLFASSHYDGSALAEAVGFEPRWTLEAALPSMVEALHRQ
jgi:nucleoside-diphosphate-sugar epimerase